MPTRSSLLVTTPSRLLPELGSTPMLAATTPSPIAQVRMPTGGTSR